MRTDLTILTDLSVLEEELETCLVRLRERLGVVPASPVSAPEAYDKVFSLSAERLTEKRQRARQQRAEAIAQHLDAFRQRLDCLR